MPFFGALAADLRAAFFALDLREGAGAAFFAFLVVFEFLALAREDLRLAISRRAVFIESGWVL
ncbi:MAG TPA: hypothetical protein VFT69_00650 [Pseudolabrys sp.]|nr:hypothetical protein [Pseudolabrys sp.]